MAAKKSDLASLKGTDAKRARALAASVKKPKFALGQLVRDPHGEIGAIDAAYADLAAAEDAGVIDDAKDFLSAQEIRPKTPRTGVWYSLVLGHGSVLCGELDLVALKGP